ncbi:hypothetical protein PUR71_37240 [Streptomyces sp. SP17BM10]|uniref:hypothetical protein n=1 Tax=Streptomyces sp. SP17BM10 TaxID=3002530 RepID=UPI002E78F608|nr:hypothetical protein [Streptomyces sp. SP17BM10]MEE1788506.1 hypothetical protein [Streptomyces sp. SP17BM10]
MARGRSKKQKRPLSDGTFRPKTAAKKAKRRPRKDRPLKPRTVRVTALLTGLLAPLLIIGLMVLGADPDYSAPCVIAAVVVLVAALGGLMTVRTTGWVLWPGVVLGLALIVLPLEVVRAEVTAHRAVRTDAVVTWAHPERDRRGLVGWKCGIRHADGTPLAHGEYTGSGCSGPSSVGERVVVLADPGNYVPPVGTDYDLAYVDLGAYAVAGAGALWGLLALAAARRTLRESSGR